MLMVFVASAFSSLAVAENMRAMVVPSASPDQTLHLDAMTIADRPVPAVVAGSGKMLVAQAASSVNPCDYQMLEGAASQSLAYPYIPGYDVAGTVVSFDASSAACGQWSVGDAIWGMSFTRDPSSGATWSVGAYAEFTLVDCAHAGAAPPAVDATEAAVLPLVSLTSMQALRVAARVAPTAPLAGTLAGKNVLILGGSGGTGHVGIQLARAMGAGRIVTTAGATNLNFTLSLGADQALDFRAAKQWYDPSVLPSSSIDVIYDCVGVPGSGDHAFAAGSVLREGGAYVTIRQRSLANASTAATRPDVLQQVVWMNQTTTAELDVLAHLVGTGQLRGSIMGRYSLSDVPAAFNASMTSRGNTPGVIGHELFGKLSIAISRQPASH
jgi:NADPH:quinone reductase-like Zn-dependent oxidoreductase